MHVGIRADQYEKNLPKAGLTSGDFHNWNNVCEGFYQSAKTSCDLLLMTGDLIDYGRGYNERDPLGDPFAYWRDRNWFLFYEMLARRGALRSLGRSRLLDYVFI